MLGRGLLVAAGLMSLAACSSTVPPVSTAPIRNSIDFPATGQEAQVAVGEEMLRQGTFTTLDGLNISAPAKIANYHLSAGFYPLMSQDAAYTYHSFRSIPSRPGIGVVQVSTDFMGDREAPQAIRVAKAGKEICLIERGVMNAVCDRNILFAFQRKNELADNDLQRRLIYQGRRGNVVRLTYREESGHYTRPASSSELEFDLSSSKTLRFREVEIDVIKADAESIRYVVRKTFPDYWNGRQGVASAK